MRGVKRGTDNSANDDCTLQIRANFNGADHTEFMHLARGGRSRCSKAVTPSLSLCIVASFDPSKERGNIVHHYGQIGGLYDSSNCFRVLFIMCVNKGARRVEQALLAKKQHPKEA